ncbi:MAG: HPr family phosphocarrier protein [Propionibacteriaceae bacterium]|jgi:phosphocarrier protein|nr:HPr family phosphocarrier protein [Propionibacteriaceae bacterium]
MQELSYTIKDPDGIHARPAGLLVKAMQGFQSKITIKAGEKQADGKKLFALMALGIKQGAAITLTADGPDEVDALASAQAILSENL